MNTRLLKINAMKRFSRWLDQSEVHHSTIDYWASQFCRGKEWENISKRLDSVQERWKFCCERAKKRKKWGSSILRSEQYKLAGRLLTYIKKRNERKKHGHK
jgi:hypothetical protein